MEATLGNIPNLTLAAELGYLQYPPARPGETRQWRRSIPEGVMSGVHWREHASPELMRYTMRTNGAYLKWQESAAQWCCKMRGRRPHTASKPHTLAPHRLDATHTHGRTSPRRCCSGPTALRLTWIPPRCG